MAATANALALGREQVAVPLDPTLLWETIAPAALPLSGTTSESDWAARLDEELDRVLGGARPARAIVAVPDRTRRAPTPQVLHALSAALAARGISLSCVVATGTHAAGAPPDWCAAVAGSTGVHVRAHDADATHRRLGATSRGTAVALDPEWIDAPLRVTLSAPGFHYFAGFGGGPKMIFPGLAQRDGILANHRLSLAGIPPGGLDPRLAPGVTEGNPVAEDIAEAAALASAHLSIHALASDDRWHFLAGDEGERRAREALLAAGVRGEARAFDVVIASAGGSPYDVDLVQAHKALFHAAAYVRDGGALVMLAEIPGGAGSAPLERWLGIEAMDELESAARSRYDGNAQTAISLRRIAERVRVFWVGARAPHWVERTGAHAGGDPAEAARLAVRAARESGRCARGAILPRAASVVPAPRGNERTPGARMESAT